MYITRQATVPTLATFRLEDGIVSVLLELDGKHFNFADKVFETSRTIITKSYVYTVFGWS